MGAIPYKNLHLEMATGRFIENDSAPSDVQVVDYAVQYVNNDDRPNNK